MLSIVAVGLIAPEHGPIRLQAERSKDKPELQILAGKYVWWRMFDACASGISVQKQREKSCGGGKKIKRRNGTCCQRHDLLFYQYFMSAFPNISWVQPSRWGEISLWSLMQFLFNWTKVDWKVFFCVWEVINMVNSAPSRMRVPRASLHICFLLTATHGLESNTFPFVALQVLNFWLLTIRQLQCRAVGGGRWGTVSPVIMKRKKKEKRLHLHGDLYLFSTSSPVLIFFY